MSEDGFLSRWSRRKVQAKQGAVKEEAPADRAASPLTPSPLVPSPVVPSSLRMPGSTQGEAVSVDPGVRRDDSVGAGQEVHTDPNSNGHPSDTLAPTLDEVDRLTPACDFTRFLAPSVDEPVKRAALKKLFADPHFNTMDGLDTYIDDYNRSEPIPLAMLKRMAQSQALGLFEEDEQAEAKASTDGAASAAVPQSLDAHPAVPPDEDPDLRLQQDDAAGRGGAGPGADA